VSIIITLTRDMQHADGTFGQLVMPGCPMLYTMEDDWLENLKGKSCIPAGDYDLQRCIFHRKQIETFEVTGVPNRTRILIHPANTEEDVEGCIGLGLRLGELYVKKDEDTGEVGVMKKAVVSSRQAFNTWMWAMQGYDTAVLQVRWATGLPRPIDPLTA